MTMSPIERRIRWAGLLITAGLAILFLSLLWVHPLSFMAFLVVGCPLILVGVLLYLYSLSAKDGSVGANVVLIALAVSLPISLSACGGSSAVPSVPGGTENSPPAPSRPVFDPARVTASVLGSNRRLARNVR